MVSSRGPSASHGHSKGSQSPAACVCRVPWGPRGLEAPRGPDPTPVQTAGHAEPPHHD